MVNQSSTTRFGIKITTVDPTQGVVNGVMKGDAQERGVLIMEIPNAFRWPQVGESWMVIQQNGTWYLEGFIPSETIQAFSPGDLVLTAPTGNVYVTGTANGAGDFLLNKAIVGSREPALSFGGDLLATPTQRGVTGNVNLVTL